MHAASPSAILYQDCRTFGIVFLYACIKDFAKDSTHKTIRVKEGDQGLLGITLPSPSEDADQLYFYRVCPFGANFSALWFQRLAGLLLRLMHLWIFVRHALMGYVDDFLFTQDRDSILYSASLLLCFTAMFGVPLSWAKLQLGISITWVGWTFNFTSGSFYIPQEKVDKLDKTYQGGHPVQEGYQCFAAQACRTASVVLSALQIMQAVVGFTFR